MTHENASPGTWRRRSRLLVMMVIVGSLIAAFTAPALGAGKGGNGGGKFTTTIAIAGGGGDAFAAASEAVMPAGDVTFAVTRSTLYDKDTIWVTNKCWDGDGNLIERRDSAVRWGMWDSYEGTTGVFTATGDFCMAYVTLRPWTDKPHGDALIMFDVVG